MKKILRMFTILLAIICMALLMTSCSGGNKYAKMTFDKFNFSDFENKSNIVYQFHTHEGSTESSPYAFLTPTELNLYEDGSACSWDVVPTYWDDWFGGDVGHEGMNKYHCDYVLYGSWEKDGDILKIRLVTDPNKDNQSVPELNVTANLKEDAIVIFDFDGFEHNVKSDGTIKYKTLAEFAKENAELD